MKNFKQPGKMLRIAAAPTGGHVAGGLYAQGDLVGVAANTVAATKPGSELSLLGVYAIPKEAALAITQGAKVYAAFSGTGGLADPANVTTTARVFVGWATKAALAADTTVEVLLPLGGYSEI